MCPYYDMIGYLNTIGPNSVPENWANTAVPKYFGNKSVIFYMEAD